MTRMINIGSRYSVDLVVFMKRIAQIAVLALTVTLLLSPPSESLDVGAFLALLTQRLFGVAVTSLDGASVVVVLVAALFGAYKIYPVLDAVEGFDEGEIGGDEFATRIGKEQGGLRVFSAGAFATGLAYALASAGAGATLEVVAAGFFGVGALTLIALVFATFKVARTDGRSDSMYVVLAQGSRAKNGKLTMGAVAKLLALAALR